MFLVLFLEDFPLPVKPPSIPLTSTSTKYLHSFPGPPPAFWTFQKLPDEIQSTMQRYHPSPLIAAGRSSNTRIRRSYHGVQVLVIVHVNGMPVQQHLPVLQRVEVLQDVDTGAFPTSRRTHQRRHFAGVQDEGHILQHRRESRFMSWLVPGQLLRLYARMGPKIWPW